MEKKHIINLNMTNKEIFESILNEITDMGFSIKDVEYGDSYFIFDGEENSICHFHIKEIPGFLFALWTTTRFDSIEEQWENNGIGWTWADGLNIDPRSDVVFFTQYERDLDKFKPSRSGFVYGIYRDKWEESDEVGNNKVVEEWVGLYNIEEILTFMKKYHFKAVEYAGRQTRYIWEQNIGSIRIFMNFISGWLYEYKTRCKNRIKYKKDIRAAKRLLNKIKMSYWVLVDDGECCTPRLHIVMRRKADIILNKYIEEQELIEKFEEKYWDIYIKQMDIDITQEKLTDEDLKNDRALEIRFTEYVSGVNENSFEDRCILYTNVKEGSLNI